MHDDEAKSLKIAFQSIAWSWSNSSSDDPDLRERADRLRAKASEKTLDLARAGLLDAAKKRLDMLLIAETEFDDAVRAMGWFDGIESEDKLENLALLLREEDAKDRDERPRLLASRSRDMFRRLNEGKRNAPYGKDAVNDPDGRDR